MFFLPTDFCLLLGRVFFPVIPSLLQKESVLYEWLSVSEMRMLFASIPPLSCKLDYKFNKVTSLFFSCCMPQCLAWHLMYGECSKLMSEWCWIESHWIWVNGNGVSWRHEPWVWNKVRWFPRCSKVCWKVLLQEVWERSVRPQSNQGVRQHGSISISNEFVQNTVSPEITHGVEIDKMGTISPRGTM